MAVLNLHWSVVREFHAAAWRHQEAAELLLHSCAPKATSAMAAEAVYLSGYVVECILKAVLFSREKIGRHTNVKLECVKIIRHDLEKIKLRLENLRKNAVVFPPEQQRNLRYVRNRWHPSIRYERRIIATEDARDFLNASRGILDWVCEGT